MNKIYIFFILIISACSFSNSLDQRFPLAKADLNIPKPITWNLQNGLMVQYLPDYELPLVKASLLFPGGAYYENVDQQSALAAVGSLIRDGGAGELSADNLDLELEKLSASISSSLGNEVGSISFSCLLSDLEQVSKLYFDVVHKPKFEVSRLKLWKQQALEAVRRRVDDPNTLAGLTFNKLLYQDGPYAYASTLSDIDHVSRLDLLKIHRKYVRPNQAIFSITGALSELEARNLVDQLFLNWEAKQNSIGEVIVPNYSAKPGIYFVEAPFQQSSIILGVPGIPRLSPDDFAIKGFNTVYSTAGFSGRLLQKLRVELGLIYGGFGSILQGAKNGKNITFIQTKSESSSESIIALYDVLKNLQNEAVSDIELNDLRQAEESSFVFLYESPEAALSRIASLKLLGYPEDYDYKYLERVRAISKSDIQSIAQRFWPLDRLIILVIGNSGALKNLEQLTNHPNFKNYKINKLNFDQKLIGEIPSMN